jgi:subtilisin family serine protease
MYNNSFANVDVFVLDTGIRITHTEFSNGRASHGFTAFGTSISDGNGHGTHVAGTIGGVKYGVCKHCRLISVKVLSDSGSGSLTSFVNGVNYVLANRRPGIPALASMSLGFSGIVASADSAVQSLINAGVVTVIAAGNSNINACNVSPARVPGAITVGATDSTDTRSSFSNFGSCVDIFAPGSAITSAYHTSNTATASLSGTSMAAPHVAGVAAAYRSYNPAKTLAEVNTYIIETLSTKNVVKSAGTLSPNRLLYSRIDLVR